MSFSKSLSLLKSIFFYTWYCPSSPRCPRRLRKGLTCSIYHPTAPADGKSNGHLPRQPHGGFADLPGLRVQLRCLSGRVLTPGRRTAPPALMLPYITTENLNWSLPISPYPHHCEQRHFFLCDSSTHVYQWF